MKSRVKRIELKMTRAAKFVYWPTVVVSLCFALIGGIAFIATAMSATNFTFSLPNLGAFALAVLFFGGGAILILRLMLKKAGFLELQPDGLLIDTYLTTGFVSWDGIAAVGPVRTWGVKCLGIAVADVDLFIASRGKLLALTQSRNRAFTQLFLRFMMVVPSTKIANVVLYLLGYTKIPESPSEADLFKWNKENFGYHILIPQFWIANIDQAIGILSVHQDGHRRRDLKGTDES
jgi:hypothetical protein